MTNDLTLVMTRRIPASAADVFAAWTDPEIMKQWFCPGDDMTVPVAEIDARPGGEFLIVMRNSDGETYSPSGTYESVETDKALEFTWKWADSDLVTRVKVELREIGAAETELTLTHSGFPDTDIRDKHDVGWTGCLSRLLDAYS